MCGRFYMDIEEKEFREILDEMERNAASLDGVNVKDHGEIYPTDTVPVLTGEHSGRLMQWGFRTFDGKGPIINARSETLMERPMFRRPALEHRCLIPATNYFEWQKAGSRKVKYALRPEEGSVFYMAGLYRMEQDSAAPRFVIITRDAAPGIRQIHDRMPVILLEPHSLAWLEHGADALQYAEKTIGFTPA